MPRLAMRSLTGGLAAVVLLLGAGCTTVFQLKVGDCFNADDSEIQSSVQTLDCADPHTYEVYALFDHEGSADADFPGETTLATFAESGCSDRFEPFVGLTYDASELYVYYLTPSLESWDNGDREVVCTVYLPDEQLTGSMRDSAR